MGELHDYITQRKLWHMYEVPTCIVPAPHSACFMPQVTDPGLGQAPEPRAPHRWAGQGSPMSLARQTLP